MDDEIDSQNVKTMLRKYETHILVVDSSNYKNSRGNEDYHYEYNKLTFKKYSVHLSRLFNGS